MNLWLNSAMSCLFYSDEDATEDFPCAVKITETEILVEYEDEGFKQYRGRNDGSGHFELRAPEIKGHASLHMFPNSTILEGSWTEGTYRGMWKIRLAK